MSESMALDCVGVKKVSAHLYEGSNRYHANIGPNVDVNHLKELAERLLGQAQECVYRKQFEEGLNTFMQVLALSEKLPQVGQEGYRGILIHNIGFCLHCLGELEAAKEYYLQSIECLQKERAERPLAKKVIDTLLSPEQLLVTVMFGSTHENRIRMTKERLIDIEFGRTPDLTMLDGWGRKRNLPNRATVEELRSQSSSMGWERRENEEEGEDSEPAWLTATKLGYASSHGQAGALREGQWNQAEVAGQAELEKEEEARRQWLHFYLEQRDWQKAAELVVTPAERSMLRELQQDEVV